MQQTLFAQSYRENVIIEMHMKEKQTLVKLYRIQEYKLSRHILQMRLQTFTRHNFVLALVCIPICRIA